ncbi:MAG TPA: RNA polymerase sigma factor [Spirochaetota bacterium]|nr:RNA polymerase sigma factor [Spirochaetota bacterium]HPJ34188.1 RNA polymerase sigma factor [Spirochaetota bacterium]
MKFSVDRGKAEFIEVYSDYYNVIFGAVCSRINSIDDAEDITQEIFLRFYRKMDEVENPRKWLFGTMKLVLYEYYRSKKPDSTDINDLINDASLSFVNGMRDLRILLGSILDDPDVFNNDDKNRIIFDLVAIQKYTLEEAAKEIGMSRDQVKYRYSLINRSILLTLKKKGVSNLEELM